LGNLIDTILSKLLPVLAPFLAEDLSIRSFLLTEIQPVFPVPNLVTFSASGGVFFYAHALPVGLILPRQRLADDNLWSG